jgi:hypothetical protein
MLEFALEYRTAIDQMAAEKGNDLRKYKLCDEEWALAGKLRDALKVCCRLDSFTLKNSLSARFSETLLCFSLAQRQILLM